MRTITALLLVGAAAVSRTLCAQPPPQPAPPPCTPAADVVCGQEAPEDLAALGPSWVAATAYAGAGGLRLIRVRDRTSHTAYPAANAKNRPDTKTYPTCPGPPDEGRFLTHGIYVSPGNGPVYKLFVVGHGAREAIEVFEVDTAPATPVVTWIGCAVAPDPIGLNSVRGLPDGGFVTTNFLPRGGDQAARQKMMAGERNGELWEWHTDSGWVKVPGSEAAGANGVELSSDGKTLYMAAWGSQSFVRLSRGATPPKRDEVSLGFRVDNVHWARDGSLWAVGQGQQSWKAVKIDPETLAVRAVLNRPDTPAFGAGTTVLEVGDDLWVGSYRGNRIAILPAPSSSASNAAASSAPSASSASSAPSASGPAPTGLVIGSGNLFSPIVSDLDRAVAFYRDGLGLDVQGPPSNADDNAPLHAMFGLPHARIRWTVARSPGLNTGVEIVEISGAGGKPLERRMQDPGAATLIVFVRDIDATLSRVKALGASVVTSGGAPATLAFRGQHARVVMVKDPDGHFVEIVEPERMPATQAPASANVVDVRVRLTVADADRAMRLYRDALGLKVLAAPEPRDDATVSAALGVPGAGYRIGIMQVPTSGRVFEVAEFKGVERTVLRGGLQDPGSTRMQLRVSDVDAAAAAFERFGGAVVSTGGKPLELPVPGSTLKVAMVRAPDNLFVVLIQAPAAR